MATTTTNYSFTLPEVGGDTDQWGGQLNANWTLADTTLKTIADSVGDDVTLTGNDYLTISGQAITVGDVDLATDVTGTLPVGSGGTGLASLGTANQVLAVNSGGTALEFQTISGSGTVTSVSVTGSDGIEVDSGSPITTSGTIALGVNATTLSTHLGLGSLATQSSVTESQISDFGTYQAADAGLTSIAGLTTAADKMLYTTASDTYAVADLTAAGRALLDDADAAAQRTTLGLGTLATQSTITESQISDLGSYITASSTDTLTNKSGNISQWTNDSGYLTAESNDLTASVTWTNVPDVNITQSSVTQHQAALSITESQISDLQNYLTAETNDLGSAVTGTLPIANGGTSATTAAGARTALGLEIGVDVQEYNPFYTKNNVSNTFTANQIISANNNTNAALRITQTGSGNVLLVEDQSNPDSTPFVIDTFGRVGIGTSTLTEFINIERSYNPAIRLRDTQVADTYHLLQASSNSLLLVGDAGNDYATSSVLVRIGNTTKISFHKTNGIVLYDDIVVNGNNIVSSSGGDINITPDTTGKIVLDGLSWPTSDGSADQVLKTDGAGNLSFVDPATGGGSGTVTSVAISGTDGIEVDSGSPITTSGTITLGVNAATLSSHLSLGTAATTAATDYATAAQGALADSAVQPGDDADTLGSGAATDGYVLTADGAGGTAWEAVSGGAASLPIDLLSSGASIRKSDGTTAVLSESSGTVTLESTSLGDTVLMPDNSNNVSTAPGIRFEADTDTGIGLASAGILAVVTGGVERLRINDSGRVSIGTTSQFGGAINVNTGGIPGLVTQPSFNLNYDACEFKNSLGDFVGWISCTSSTTSYATSSDYRLKEDWHPMLNSIDRLKALNPVNFAWKIDGSRVDGFLAHEAQEVVPEAVTGSKDAVDEDGNPVYQGIDQAKLVPLLTAALQEAIAKIDALETRIQALEV